MRWDHETGAALLVELENYYDTVPRSNARAEELGPLTLFVREGAGWPYYARPTLTGPGSVTADVVAVGAVTADAVARVRARQRELGVPESFEWVAETTPALRAAAEEAGLTVREHPLMVLDPDRAPAGVPETGDGVRVRILEPGDPALPSALAVPHLAFAEPGTATGPAGPPELAAAVRRAAADGTTAAMEERMRAGRVRIAAAVTPEGLALCSGQHQPVGPVTEVVGVGTLPSARRRGLGAAVTAALAADARARGAHTVFLSAGDEEIARLYARLGFRRVGTALIAEAD
ncbi:GNAT family N-acetyltransferase [Streptomyces sp. NPDC000594]|uniref:GNAT family N-acetyltransferase n=1 Tax=Streptomyces sp. NPDC000594 TaxID=3154261 RepID=UPI0033210CE0